MYQALHIIGVILLYVLHLYMHWYDYTYTNTCTCVYMHDSCLSLNAYAYVYVYIRVWACVVSRTWAHDGSPLVNNFSLITLVLLLRLALANVHLPLPN